MDFEDTDILSRPHRIPENADHDIQYIPLTREGMLGEKVKEKLPRLAGRFDC